MASRGRPWELETRWRRFADVHAGRDYVVLATVLELRSASTLPRFEWFSLRISRALSRSDGLVGWSFRGRFPTTYWTLSVWESHRDLLRFVRSPAHASAMRALAGRASRFGATRWSADAGELPPSWAEALRRLDEAADDRPASTWRAVRGRT